MMFSDNLFYFIFGFVACLFVYVVVYRKKIEELHTTDYTDRNAKFYLNIFFNNKKEVVENIVRSKVSKNRRVIRALAKRLAVNMISNETLMQRIAADLVTSIPVKLELSGIRVSCSVAYLQSSFACVEVEILSCDLLKMIEVNASKSAAKKFNSFLNKIQLKLLFNFIESFLGRLLLRKIMTMLPGTIEEKLQDKLLADVAIIALTEEEIGPFIIQTIQQLNEAKASISNESTN